MRRTSNLLMAAIVAFIVTLIVPGAAFATTLPTLAQTGYSSCSKTWNSNPYGGQVTARYVGTFDGTNSRVTLMSGYDKVVGPRDCGPAGYPILMSRVDITATVTITGTALTTCSAGFPWTFSCTGSSTSVSSSLSATCYDKYQCVHEFSNLAWYAGNGGNFNNVYMSMTVKLYSPSGSAYTFGVNRTGSQGF